MTLVIVDIDGTIADIGPRLAAAGPEPLRGNKQEFQQWLDRLQNDETLLADKPVAGMLQLVRAIDYGATVLYLTGRSEKYRAVTERWLEKYDFPVGPLIMRNDNDWRTAAAYKQYKLDKIKEEYTPDNIVAIDDDGSGDCAEMYVRNGVTHLKVINKWSVNG